MIVALTLMSAAVAQSPMATSTTQPSPTRIQGRAADEARIRERASAWGAAFTRGDVDMVDNLLADDFVGTAKDATLYDKSTMLKWVRAGPNLSSSKTTVGRIRFFGDIAIATGTDDMVGLAPSYRQIKTIWTDIWARANGEWRVVAAHDMTGKPE